ncbi:MAG: metal ABC transporter ATP-binding protein [Rhodospirillaceae bacterium]|nr:metal ABC transporter ATP-binding protein [Rhodospirillaceae bacterium]
MATIANIDAPSAGALIALRHGCISRGGRKILDNVDFTVDRGEIVTLIGPNGAGKSTLVKAALGLERLDSGALWRAPDLTVGYQPQKYSLDPALPLSVRRLVTLNSAAPADRIKDTLALFRLERLEDADIHTLSGGELQRAMLARAFLRAPNLLVLDEPSQNLDVGGTMEIYRLIADVRKTSGCAVLVVSHDLNVVMAATDKVYCLNTHLCCSGPPEDVGRHKAFLDLFGAAAAHTLAIYPHHHDHEHAPDGSIAPPSHGHDHAHGRHHHHGHHHDR